MALTRPRYSQIYDTDYKQSVRLATTSDVGNLSAGGGNITNTVDGITVIANDRILVKDQDNAEQNGIYRVVTVGTGSDGTWERALDSNANDKVTSGMTTVVTAGATHSGTTWKLTTADPIILGTTELTFINPFQQAVPGAAGSGTHIQYNMSGSLTGSDAFTFNETGNILTVSGSANITTANITTIRSTTGNITNLTSSNLTLPGTLTLGTQKFWTQGNDGFSVNEDFNIGNAIITGYHYTSGSGRESVAFTLARTGEFTNGFGIHGTSSDNEFVIGSEFANSKFKFKKSIGMPFDVRGGTTLFEIQNQGNLVVYGNITPNSANLYSIGTSSSRWKQGHFNEITTTGNLTVGGNLTVSGDLTYLSVDTLRVDDPVIYIGYENPSDLVDLGMISTWSIDSVRQYGGIVRDATDKIWKFFSNVSQQPDTTIDFDVARYDTVLVGNLISTGNVVATGNVTLNKRLYAGGTSGTGGQVLTSTVTGVAWSDIDQSAISDGGGMTVTVDGEYANIEAPSGNLIASFSDDRIQHGHNTYRQKQYILHGITEDASETELFINGKSSNRIPVTSATTILYDVDIVTRRTDATGVSASWHLKGCADNFSGTVADVGDIYEIVVARDDANLLVDCRANDTTNSLNVYVTGISGQTFRWTAVVRTIEVSE